MKSIRRLAYATLALAYLQIVFGAIMRITGSGLGCGTFVWLSVCVLAGLARIASPAAATEKHALATAAA